MGEREPLVDGADVCDAVAAVHHHARQQALRVQRQHRLEERKSSSLIWFGSEMNENLVTFHGIMSNQVQK